MNYPNLLTATLKVTVGDPENGEKYIPVYQAIFGSTPALDVYLLFQERGYLTVKEIMKTLDMGPATAYRIVNMFKNRGVIFRERFKRAYKPRSGPAERVWRLNIEL